MPDDPKPDAPDDKPDDDDKPDTPDTPPDTGDEAAKWKALAKKHENEAKKLRKERDDLDNAGKSELEKAADRATDAEKRASASEARALRLEIAAEKGLSAKQAGRLVGESREDLEADADSLLEEFGGKPTPGGRPTENLRGGNEPDDEPDEKDPRKLAANVPHR